MAQQSTTSTTGAPSHLAICSSSSSKWSSRRRQSLDCVSFQELWHNRMLSNRPRHTSRAVAAEVIATCCNSRGCLDPAALLSCVASTAHNCMPWALLLLLSAIQMTYKTSLAPVSSVPASCTAVSTVTRLCRAAVFAAAVPAVKQGRGSLCEDGSSSSSAGANQSSATPATLQLVQTCRNGMWLGQTGICICTQGL
jgi:hypothetical protein